MSSVRYGFTSSYFPFALKYLEITGVSGFSLGFTLISKQREKTRKQKIMNFQGKECMMHSRSGLIMSKYIQYKNKYTRNKSCHIIKVCYIFSSFICQWEDALFILREINTLLPSPVVHHAFIS